MVRFIIYTLYLLIGFFLLIYIPLWLDLLSNGYSELDLDYLLFTFHYGQIYYYEYQAKKIAKEYIYIPLWLDLL